MRRLASTFVVTALLLTAMSPASAAPDPLKPTSLEDAEVCLAHRINEVRREHGFDPLIIDTLPRPLLREHSVEQARSWVKRREGIPLLKYSVIRERYPSIQPGSWARYGWYWYQPTPWPVWCEMVWENFFAAVYGEPVPSDGTHISVGIGDVNYPTGDPYDPYTFGSGAEATVMIWGYVDDDTRENGGSTTDSTDEGRSGENGTTSALSFLDVSSSVFREDIDKLAASGITKGCNPPQNDRFCPDGR